MDANGKVVQGSDCVLVCPSKGECDAADTCCETNGKTNTVTTAQTYQSPTDIPSAVTAGSQPISVSKSQSKSSSGKIKESSMPLLEEENLKFVQPDITQESEPASTQESDSL